MTNPRDTLMLMASAQIDEALRTDYVRALHQYLEEELDANLPKSANADNGAWFAGYSACLRDLTKFPEYLRQHAEVLKESLQREQEAATEPKSSTDPFTKAPQGPAQLTLG